MTVEVFQLFYFDRSGAACTRRIDIHQDAVTFVQLVQFLSNPDLSTLGFDPNVYWDDDQRYMDILSGERVIKYSVESILFQHPAIFGSNTTCWVARETGTKARVVIKDKWRGEGCDSEADLLVTAREAAIPGVTCLLAVDETCAAEGVLTTPLLRQSQCLNTAADKNYVFSRIVVQLCGPSIRHFRSGLHMLQTFRDSIQCMFFFHSLLPLC